jgi:hypothetical protein
MFTGPQGPKMSLVFWSTLVKCLEKVGVRMERMGQSIVMFVALMSARLDCPVFVQLKARRPETILEAAVPCLKIVPAECYIDSLKVPKWKTELSDGKVVVSTTGTGLPPKDTEFLHQSCLRKEPKIGYVGALRENDPLQEQSSVLVVNLDANTSAIVNRLTNYCPPEVRGLSGDAQAVILQAHSKLLCLDDPTFAVDFLKKALTMEKPERMPILRAIEAIGKMSIQPFSGSDVKLLGSTDEARLEDIYGFARELLEPHVRVSKPLTHEIGENSIAVYNTMKALGENDGTKHSWLEISNKLEEMKGTVPSRSSFFRILKSLTAQGIIKRDGKAYELINNGVEYDAYSKLKLPTVEELFPAEAPLKQPQKGEINGSLGEPEKRPGSEEGGSNNVKLSVDGSISDSPAPLTKDSRHDLKEDTPAKEKEKSSSRKNKDKIGEGVPPSQVPLAPSPDNVQEPNQNPDGSGNATVRSEDVTREPGGEILPTKAEIPLPSEGSSSQGGIEALREFRESHAI